MPPPPRLKATLFGERGLLIEVGASPRVIAAVASAVTAADPTLDAGAGSSSLLVVSQAPLDPLRRAEVQAMIARALAGARSARPEPPRRHDVDVIYDGEDLPEVAAAVGVTTAEVISRHQEPDYQVEVLGFLPGFAYLGGLDPRLHRPRRATPRPRVPARSVAIAGAQSAIYPVASAGGWSLLGRALIDDLFDPARDPPARFALGDVVRFRAVDGAPVVAGSSANGAARAGSAPIGPALVVEKVAAMATVQDAGRKRWLGRGVPPSGALDPVAHTAAQLAVGNDPGAAGIEVAGGPLRLRARGELVVSIDGEPARSLADGEQLVVAAGSRLCRYLAVRGGVDLPEVLGSRATAVAAALGPWPAPLRAGDALAVGPDPGTPRPARSLLPVPGSPDPLVLRIQLAPALEPLGPASIDALLEGVFSVSPAIDRMGVRLAGSPVPRAAGSSARPEPVIPGVVQLPPDGMPIVLGPDAAVTGGYPVLGVLRATSLWSLYRLRPGARVRFQRA